MIHQDESTRLSTLALYQILDTSAEKAFDDLTRLAASICGTPTSLITFIDEDRNWIKASTGSDIKETPRDLAFCDHTIRQEGIMIVEDASLDPRFANNPLVLKDPSIRFYAGVPLTVSGGLNIGSLCVVDSKPRELNDQQIASLGILCQAVVTQLELRRAMTEIKAMEKLLPMCAWCRRIKTDETEGNHWQSLHEYLMTTPVTHGICPDCRIKVGAEDEP